MVCFNIIFNGFVYTIPYFIFKSKDVYVYIARAKIYYYNDNDYDDYLAEDDLYTALKMGSEEAKRLLDELFSDDEEEDGN